MIGKFDLEDLSGRVFSRTGADSDAVRVGPAAGEDAAAIEVGDETLVVSTDPISLAAERIGRLGVVIASNDVAASGGVPGWLLSTLLLPEHDIDLLETIAGQVDEAARELDVSIVGGHTESVAGIPRPIVSMTCMGVADRFVPTGGAEPGDVVVLTKGAGIEATAVLATDFRGDLLAADVDGATLERAGEFFEELSVLPESRQLSPVASAMHDPTEGGVLAGLVELAVASGVHIDVDAVPVRAETRQLCEAMAVDPLRVLGSGSLLATVPESRAGAALDALADADIRAARVGIVEAPVDGPGVTLADEHYGTPTRDDMYRLWE